MLSFALEAAGDLGVEEAVIGMAHRGRLNVLANVLHKEYDDIFAEFEDNYLPKQEGGGDVKYHKGYSSTYRTRTWKELSLTLAANPSHLEAVDPIVGGRARAKQRLRGDTARKRVIPILIHGDAAFCGQGIVAECLQMSNLPGYTTGGTVHLIVNNQIGFTTDPINSRSSVYCTDVAKTIQAPIFHVNGDDPEMCAWIVKLAVEFRQKFGRDVVVDMWCYRKHGHNEADEPAFTQPKMYELIRKMKSTTQLYQEKLKAEGVITEAEIERMKRDIEDVLDRAQQEGKEVAVKFNQTGFRKVWTGIQRNFTFDPVDTTVPMELLKEIAVRLAHIPEGFTPHRKLVRLIEQRRQVVLDNAPMDWATAEALCFGSLLREGIPVRLSGQDSQRGTFSQRHAVLTDMNTEEDYIPLNFLSEKQARFCIYDSPLAEASVLGFEYGYSLGDPKMLIMWEAQFGDFANGAQVIIDQFIVSAEAKWDRSSGLVLLLPHGYEGQGPEHSSARIERFLQLCADENIQVVYPTTPAQYFHLLRRQMKRSFRKPLVVMTPKSLLRHPKAVSLASELASGGFLEVLDDPEVKDPMAITRLMLCSGKVYYDLLEERERTGRKDTAIIRLEQLYPLHTTLLRSVVERYPKASGNIIWAQEEPKNMGGWLHLSAWIEEELGVRMRYVGRPEAPAPAVGSKSVHEREVMEFMAAAFPLQDAPVPAGAGTA
jgi:2-oxoglutarate dehydrogenase E1 component